MQYSITVSLDEDVKSRYCEINGIEEMSSEEFIEREFGWLEDSGIRFLWVNGTS